jgi:hypothetical protein
MRYWLHVGFAATLPTIFVSVLVCTLRGHTYSPASTSTGHLPNAPHCSCCLLSFGQVMRRAVPWHRLRRVHFSDRRREGCFPACDPANDIHYDRVMIVLSCVMTNLVARPRCKYDDYSWIYVQVVFDGAVSPSV